MKEIGLTIIRTGMACFIMLMDLFMKGSGRMISKMEMGKSGGVMGHIIMERL